ncbi:MAG: histidinol dehydrogenase [Lachnospiraceae bacterium]|nr:histidinol dehydrogenase [Lachnospiraceae bacterium]
MIPIIRYETEDGKKIVEQILSRSQLEHGNVQEIVEEILSEVRKNGDKAVFSYTKQFDKIDIDASSIKVSKEEIDYAYTQVSEDLIRVIRNAAARIKDFHQKQKMNSWFEPNPNGEILGQLIRPLENVGVYVPGGKAAYPSSVIMNVIPAHVAGVKNIYMTTPAQKDGRVYPTTIVAAVEAGVTEIFKTGGAQAIAALAYGTESVPKVDKICGPGNIFVALAKRTVYGHVNIDSVAGPSEILIIADSSANVEYVAADMLSQAEHDELASAILITTEEKLAKEVQLEIEKQTAVLERKEIIEKSINNFGAIIVVDTIEKACEISNGIAPEHMELCTASPFELLPLVQNAGAIFMGHYSPEPLGDYMAGPNHVLPTGGTARFFSPLSIDDFIKKSSIISFSKNALLELQQDIIDFANAEGLTAHANAVRVRK